jgi:AraC-like DNA-binding protein
MGLVDHGRMPRRGVDGVPARPHPSVEIRSLMPAGPFVGLIPEFGDDTKVLFVVEGAKAVAVRRNISVRTLLRRFREGGRSLSHVRQECRADLVAVLLASGVPVAAVARAVGLSGPQALGRFVRTCFGLTPTRLRDEMRKRAAAVR